MRNIWILLLLFSTANLLSKSVGAADSPPLNADLVRLLKKRCVKCHGPAKREAKLDLSTADGIARGGENGAVVVPGSVAKSLIWKRVTSNEMPPDAPLPAIEKTYLKLWISAGARGLPKVTRPTADHWAFKSLIRPKVPAVGDTRRLRTSIDRFVQAKLAANKLAMNPETDRATLIRRVCFDLTGLPPTPDEIHRFLDDRSPDACERLIEHYLASPHYGERWGKYWLDTAGYADSNGYFGADTDRPLAYRYRDYVIRSFNQDKPFDQFVREQLAGDELSGFVAGKPATPEMIELLEASHYVRNGQDGTGESDGNPDELRVDRYAALESTQQIVTSSLLGMTFQCAKCHDHKFEPITQRDFYQLQSVFYPVFNIDKWIKPNERFVYANLPGELQAWTADQRQLNQQLVRLTDEYQNWIRAHRERGTVLFADAFETDASLAPRWSNTAPGDDSPGGAVPVNIDSAQAPAARIENNALQIIEGNTKGDRWISTRQSFDWTPKTKGAWIEATFYLIADRVNTKQTPAARIAYFVALHDFNDNSSVQQGNILIDGNPGGGAAVHVDYPGDDSKSRGSIGKSGYKPEHNYGVRITNVGDGKFRLEQLVDWIAEAKPLTLSAEDLPNGGFGFEYCCGRSFIVDNVAIERSNPTIGDKVDKTAKQSRAQFEARKKTFAADSVALKARRTPKPGKIAWATDLSATPPDVHLLNRGSYKSPGIKVVPAAVGILSESGNPFGTTKPNEQLKSTGRRLNWATWVTGPNSKPAALLARVRVNRIWQHHFGTGLVATPDNLGISGAAPSHPELLEWLASEFIRSGWSIKAMHRLLMRSAAYRQSSAMQETAYRIDPAQRLLWRYPLRRLDAESIRDAMLALSGDLDSHMGGPYVATQHTGAGEVVVNETQPGARRRSIYLRQRRTQVLSLLAVFDSPSLVYNCVQRTKSTMPLQSLSLLNSDFAIARARSFANRLRREAQADRKQQIEYAFVLVYGRSPSADEIQFAGEFLDRQLGHYSGQADAADRCWADFCQMLLASNAFLYVE